MYTEIYLDKTMPCLGFALRLIWGGYVDGDFKRKKKEIHRKGNPKSLKHEMPPHRRMPLCFALFF